VTIIGSIRRPRAYNGTMFRALAPLLLAASGAPTVPVIQHEEAPDAGPEVVALRAAEDVGRLCRVLEPAERFRVEGNAVDRGEAEDRHDTERDRALERRYRVVIPSGRILFAPYDSQGRKLGLSFRAELRGAEGALRVWAIQDRGLPVEVDAETARRVLAAQAAGRLTLEVVFALADDATCGGAPATRRWALAMDPVSWTYRRGDAVLARGGAAADRPAVTLVQGARARVEVGDPLAGPPDARAQVDARRTGLEACYAEALKRDPALDGVLVADLAAGKAEIAADSIGDAKLAGCIRTALEGAGTARAAVPIRFTLEPPAAGAGPVDVP
jgi:hypothetical protein